jgi:hypothetical protein
MATRPMRARAVIILGTLVGLAIAVSGCSNSTKKEVARITGDTIRNACANWKRCTVKCETPDPYTGSCENGGPPDYGKKDD